MEPTYDPEKPPLHVVDGNHVASILDHVGHEDRAHPERGVEARVHQTEASEEALHRQEGEVHLDTSISYCLIKVAGAARTKSSKVKKPPAERERPVMK